MIMFLIYKYLLFWDIAVNKEFFAYLSTIEIIAVFFAVLFAFFRMNERI